MAARDVRKFFNVFVDGQGYAGQAEEFNPPKLTLKTDEFRAGGMAAPIEITMGMEKLEADFTLISFDKAILALFGVVEGNNVSFIVREALESFDGTVTPVVHTMRCKIKELDQGSVQPGTAAKLKVSVAASYYKLQHGDNVVQEVDVENLVQNINGADVLSAFRGALGI